MVGVCRDQSVAKLDEFAGRITVVPGATDDREVIKQAVQGCDGVITVLVPRGVHGYSSQTAQAVLDFAQAGARLIFSSGWHISLDGQDVYSRRLRFKVVVLGGIAKLLRAVDLDDQVEACRRVFASDSTRWTVVRGSELEEGESEGLPVWSRHVGDPILKSNTARAEWTLRCSWLRHLRTTSWCTRHPRSSVAERPRPLPRPAHNARDGRGRATDSAHRTPAPASVPGNNSAADNADEACPIHLGWTHGVPAWVVEQLRCGDGMASGRLRSSASSGSALGASPAADSRL